MEVCIHSMNFETRKLIFAKNETKTQHFQFQHVKQHLTKNALLSTFSSWLSKKEFHSFWFKGYASLKFDDFKHFLDFELVNISFRTCEDIILPHEQPFRGRRLYSMTTSTSFFFSTHFLMPQNVHGFVTKSVRTTNPKWERYP